MLDLEDQIRLLADHAEGITAPVTLHSVTRRGRRGRQRLLVVAAIITVAALAAAGLWEASSSKRQSEWTGSTIIDNPMAIDLDDAIAASDQQRLSTLGPLLTFDFAALAPVWLIEEQTAITTSSPFAPAGYWHQVTLRSGTAEAVVNVMGTLNGNTVTLSDTDDPNEPIEVRGRPGRQFGRTTEWVEQDRATVTVVPGPGGNVLADDLAELVATLDPIEAELPWGMDERGFAGPPLSDPAPLLAGELTGIDWGVTANADEAVLVSGPSNMPVGRTSRTEPAIPNSVAYSIDPWPGGVIVYGTAPSQVTAVRLRLGNGSVEIPTAAGAEGLVVFAVPVDDRLDPTSVDLVGALGRVRATIDLTSLAPYTGGSLSSATSLND